MTLAPEYLKASDGNGEAATATVTTYRAPGDTNLITDTVSHWPVKGIATSGKLKPDGTLDQTTVTVFSYVLTGSIIVIDSIAPGYTDMGNEVGQRVVVKPTTLWADTVVANLGEGGSSNLDGGLATSTYGGIMKVNGGTA